MDQTRLNPEHVRVTPEGVRMMTLSRLNEILDAWESLTWPASRADAAAFRDRFGWTPDPRESLLFTSDVVPERSRKAAASARLAGHVRDSHASRSSLRRDSVIMRAPSGVTRTCSGFNGALLTFPVFQFAAGFAVEEVEQVTRLRWRVQR